MNLAPVGGASQHSDRMGHVRPREGIKPVPEFIDQQTTFTLLPYTPKLRQVAKSSFQLG